VIVDYFFIANKVLVVTYCFNNQLNEFMNKQKYNQYYIQSELASVTVIPSMIAASPFALLHDLSPPSAAFVRKISSKGAKIECLLDV